jgi:hypothetical protein
MAVPKRNLHGLQNIRTLSGNVDQKSVPYRAFMRLTVLEMEKARRGKERDSAVHRVKNIEARFHEIEAEKDELLRAVGERKGNGTSHAQIARGKSEAEPPRGGKSFKLRY